MKSYRGRGGVVSGLVWTAGGDGGGKLALLVTTVMAARFLSPASFGTYVALAAVSVVAASLWDAGISTLVTRQTAAGEAAPRTVIREVTRLRLILAPVWITAFFGAAFVVGGLTWNDWPVLAGFAAASIIFATHAIGLGYLRGCLRFRAAATSLAVGRVATALAASCLLVALPDPDRLAGTAAATALGEATTLLVVCLVLMRSARAEPAELREHHRLTLRRSLPFAANGLLYMAYNRLDVVIVPALAGASQLALYAPASRIQDALYVFPFALQTVAIPVATVLLRREDPSALGRFALKLIVGGLAIALPTSGCVCLFAPELINHVLGPAYNGATTPVRILVWFLPLAVVQAPIFACLIAMGRAVDTTKIIGIAFATAAVMHVALDPHWGAVGGAIASLSRDVVAVPATLLIGRRVGLFGRSREHTHAQLSPKPSSI